MTKPILSQDLPVLIPLKRPDALKAASSVSDASKAEKELSDKPLTSLQKGKHLLMRANAAFFTFTLTTLFFVDRVFGSKALTQVEDSSEKISKLVAGPIGKVTLIGGTLVGAWGVFQKGSILGSVAILIIGMLTSWNVADIMKVFGD